MTVEDPYELKKLPPELVARLKEEAARRFKPRDFVYGTYRTPDGRINPNSDVFTIARWSNDHEHTVYIRKGSKESYPPEDQIRALSGKVQTQQTAFGSLDPSEQSRIRTDSSGDRTRFGDYLANEALAAQFQKLK